MTAFSTPRFSPIHCVRSVKLRNVLPLRQPRSHFGPYESTQFVLRDGISVVLKRKALMRYPSGEEIRLWDRVELWADCHGIVVFSIDTDEYSPAFPKEEWAYLKRGVMVASDRVGLIHYSSECGQTMVLLARGTTPSEDEWAPLKAAQDRQGGGKGAQ